MHIFSISFHLELPLLRLVCVSCACSPFSCTCPSATFSPFATFPLPAYMPFVCLPRLPDWRSCGAKRIQCLPIDATHRFPIDLGRAGVFLHSFDKLIIKACRYLRLVACILACYLKQLRNAHSQGCGQSGPQVFKATLEINLGMVLKSLS